MKTTDLSQLSLGSCFGVSVEACGGAYRCPVDTIPKRHSRCLGHRAYLCPVEQTHIRRDSVGPHTVDVVCVVVAQVSRPGHSKDAHVGLRGPRAVWSGEAARREKIVAMPADRPGEIAFSTATFADPKKIDAYFRDRTGRWVIVQIQSHHRHPRKMHEHPFTSALPCPGSYVVWAQGELLGPIAGPSDWAEQWIVINLPNGRYTPMVLERVAVIDHGPAEGPPPDHRDFWPVRRRSIYVIGCRGEAAYLSDLRSSPNAARRSIGNAPGMWLLASYVTGVCMY